MLQSLSLSTSTSLTSPLNVTTSSFTNSSIHGVRVGFARPTFGALASEGTRSSAVVMMAKKDEELKDIRSKTNEEIDEEIIDLKGELFMLRLQKSARADFKPSEFGRMRRKIARMMTVKREREIEQGIGKRLSRKLDFKWKRSLVFRQPPSLKKKIQEAEAAAAAAEEKSS